MNTLFVIPARGGSKGLVRKNIRLLKGKPLICYSIDIARAFTSDDHICISTDDSEIVDVVEKYGLEVPFIRPPEMATDSASVNDVLLHALDHYASKGMVYDAIVLLQPTSPLRRFKHVKEAISQYKNSIEMVVSVRPSHSSAIICNEDQDGFLELTLSKNASRRQDVQGYYEYNGSIYVINVESLKKLGIANFTKKEKYLMKEEDSVDIDTILDWMLCEAIIDLKHNGEFNLKLDD